MRVPAAFAALPLLAGACLGLLTEPAGPETPLLLAGAAGLALLAAAGAWLLRLDADCVVAAIAGCVLAGVSLGACEARRVYHPPLLSWFEALDAAARGDPLVISGRLREDAAPAAGGYDLILDVDRVAPLSAGRALERLQRISGGIRLTVAGQGGAARAAGWRAGRRVRTVAILRTPTYYLDPGVPDARRTLARRGIVLVGTVKSAVLVDVIAHGSIVAEASGAVRAWARRVLDQAVGGWSERSGAVAKAVLIGDRSALDEDDTRRLQDAGTYHVIAISGGNIAVFTAILLGLARAARVPPRSAPLLTAVALAGYGTIVVPGPSVSRAIAAALIYLAVRALDHRAASLNLLAFVAVLAAAASPVKVLDAGFLLSFGATLGILLVVPRTPAPGRRARALRRAGHVLLLMLVTTAAAETALLPIGAALFGRVTGWGLLLNFAAVPLMSLLQAGAMAALGLAARADLARAAGWIAHVSSEGILRSARLTGSWSVMTREVPAPAWWLVAVYYAAAVLVLCRGRPYLRRCAAAALTAACAAIVAGPAWAGQVSRPPAGALRVAFLDVGQADATVLILPDGRALLVDAALGPLGPLAADPGRGGGFDAGQQVVAPALRALGVRRLEALVITHGDPDHVGGAGAVAARFRPRAIWEGVPVPPHAGLSLLAELASALGASWRTVQAGDVERFGPVTIRVLHPPRPEWERQRVRNEDSVVLEVTFGGVAIVLPGDIGAEGEAASAALLRDRPPLLVLKAPHHGSASSSTPAFLRALQPGVVVFSAGRPSRYGHPAPAVVARYRARGTAIFSTPEDGAVVLDTDGETVELKTATGRLWRWRMEHAAPPSGAIGSAVRQGLHLDERTQ